MPGEGFFWLSKRLQKNPERFLRPRHGRKYSVKQIVQVPDIRSGTAVQRQSGRR